MKAIEGTEEKYCEVRSLKPISGSPPPVIAELGLVDYIWAAASAKESISIPAESLGSHWLLGENIKETRLLALAFSYSNAVGVAAAAVHMSPLHPYRTWLQVLLDVEYLVC